MTVLTFFCVAKLNEIKESARGCAPKRVLKSFGVSPIFLCGAGGVILRMQPYVPISRAVYEVLEELYLLKQSANITFSEAFQKRTVIDAHITDLYTEAEGEYLVLEGGIRLRLDALVAINGKPVQYFV